MTEKRFEIINSNLIIDGARFIKDNENEYTFAATLKTETLITYAKALNKLNDDNKQLKMGIESLKLLVQNWEALDEEKDEQLDRQNQALKKLRKENEQLKSFIDDLTTKRTGRIDLANGYSYSVSAVLTNWKGDDLND